MSLPLHSSRCASCGDVCYSLLPFVSTFCFLDAHNFLNPLGLSGCVQGLVFSSSFHSRPSGRLSTFRFSVASSQVLSSLLTSWLSNSRSVLRSVYRFSSCSGWLPCGCSIGFSFGPTVGAKMFLQFIQDRMSLIEFLLSSL